MLTLAAIALILPAAFHYLVQPVAQVDEQTLASKSRSFC